MTKHDSCGPLDDGLTADRIDSCVTSIKPTLREITLQNHNFNLDPESGVGVCSRCGLEIIAPKLWWDANIQKISI